MVGLRNTVLTFVVEAFNTALVLALVKLWGLFLLPIPPTAIINIRN